MSSLPCVLFEDEHLLVVNKPAGMNTHAPDPYTGEGIYEHLRHREPRWAQLAIIHRLDKDTSGLLVLSKTTEANRSLTRQFTNREVTKRYLFLTDGEPRQPSWRRESCLVRTGEKYASSRVRSQGERTVTLFELVHEEVEGLEKAALPSVSGRLVAVWASPLTGRTHQIRVHAAEAGCPILGDTLYGGTLAHRVCLHAAELSFKHPGTGERKRFWLTPDFRGVSADLLREALIDPEANETLRLIHGASDRWPECYLDRLGNYLLSHAAGALTGAQSAEVERQAQRLHSLGTAHRLLNRQIRNTMPGESSPKPASGKMPAGPFVIRENGLSFEMSFSEGSSTGLFLDQRDNRRRLLTGHIAAGFSLAGANPAGSAKPLTLLNTFAYTCGFSVCAAKQGAQTTSLDLSKKYLAWGKRNFALNQINPAGHDFVHGDVFEWLRRLAKKGRLFGVVILDPPTFSQSRESGVFRAEKDYGRLVRSALGVLGPGGVLFSSTNAETWTPDGFVKTVESAVAASERRILQRHYAPQPPDFPVSRREPAHLKTLWLRVE